ncbi:protein tweety homolog 3-like isoform X2 [Rhopilema esculentum]|uniref:protein tweety homolog 3-like isoform X2 n=1 Tax=Rhopilema esculentum TaxID=499914 RepID=UPI0031DA115B
MAPSKWLAEMFHSFPHLDFDFKNATSIFSPTENSYQQALMFNGLIILFVTALLFLVFTFYFLICSCYYCSSCFPSVLKPRPSKSRSLRFLIAFFAVLSCAPLGLGFYGNNKTMDGVNSFSKASADIYNQWDLYKFKNMVLGQFINKDASNAVKNLKDALVKYSIPIPSVLQRLDGLLLSISSGINISTNDLKGSEFSLKDLADEALEYDKIRWWTTIGILLWHLLLVLSVLYGAWGERRFFIPIIAIEGVLSILFMMSSVGIEVPLSVGAGDLCVNPKAAITQHVKNPVYRVIENYYLDCFNGSGNPLIKKYIDTSKMINLVETDVKILEKDEAIIKLLLNETVPYVDDLKKAIKSSKADLDGLVSILDCKYINQRYKAGVDAVCYTVLSGLSLIILAALIISVFVICQLLCLTPIWKSMAKLKRDHFPDSSWDTSLDASYKSIDEDQREQQRAGRYDTQETVPLVLRRGERPPSYHAVHGETEFLSVEEDRKRLMSAESAS